MRKCKYTKGCQNEAIWAMQFIGEDKPSFYAFGWHIRGFKVTPVCDDCFNKENDRQQALLKSSEAVEHGV